MDGSRYFLSRSSISASGSVRRNSCSTRTRRWRHYTRPPLGHPADSEPTSLLEAILTRAAALVDTPHAYLYVVDQPQDRLMVSAGIGVFGDYVGQRGPGRGLAGRYGRAARRWRWATTPAGAEDQRFRLRPGRGGHPAPGRGQLMGVIGLVRLDEGPPFQEQEIELLARFGHFASLALENARLYEAARRSWPSAAVRRRAGAHGHGLREANEELRKANELKSHFVAVASTRSARR